MTDERQWAEKRLDHLMTYTTFHIGVYISLTTAFMGAAVFGKADHWTIRSAVVFFLLAGACGGLIASNIADHDGAPERFFEPRALSFWGLKGLSYRPLAWLEHVAFWAGILPVVIYFFACRGEGSSVTAAVITWLHDHILTRIAQE